MRKAVNSIKFAVIQHFHLLALFADDMVVVIFRVSQLVSCGAIAKFASPNQTGFLKAGEATINRYQVADLLGNRMVNLFGSERSMVINESLKNRFSRLGYFEVRAP